MDLLCYTKCDNLIPVAIPSIYRDITPKFYFGDEIHSSPQKNYWSKPKELV